MGLDNINQKKIVLVSDSVLSLKNILNTTRNITQITLTKLCNLHVWVAKKINTMHKLENIKLLCHVIQSQTIITALILDQSDGQEGILRFYF